MGCVEGGGGWWVEPGWRRDPPARAPAAGRQALRSCGGPGSMQPAAPRQPTAACSGARRPPLRTCCPCTAGPCAAPGRAPRPGPGRCARRGSPPATPPCPAPRAGWWQTRRARQTRGLCGPEGERGGVAGRLWAAGGAAGAAVERRLAAQAPAVGMPRPGKLAVGGARPARSGRHASLTLPACLSAKARFQRGASSKLPSNPAGLTAKGVLHSVHLHPAVEHAHAAPVRPVILRASKGSRQAWHGQAAGRQAGGRRAGEGTRRTAAAAVAAAAAGSWPWLLLGPLRGPALACCSKSYTLR